MIVVMFSSGELAAATADELHSWRTKIGTSLGTERVSLSDDLPSVVILGHNLLSLVVYLQ